MKPKTVPQKRYYLLFSLYFLVFGTMVAFLTSLVNYKTTFTDINNALKDLAKSEAAFKKDFIYNYISETESLLASIARNELTFNFINTGTAGDRANLTSLFYAMVFAHQEIMQLRYINPLGREVIRIDREKKTPQLTVFQKDQLQNKAHRYYFIETSLLMASQFWHSNLDLNIEHGKIETPFKPTFRVATQVVLKNSFKGIVIVNLLFEDTIRILTSSANFNIYLADNNGEIIHNPDTSQSWSKYSDKKNTLHEIFPGNSLKILRNKSFYTDRVYSFSFGELFKNKENLTLIFTPKKEVLEVMQKKNLLSAMFIALTVLIVSIPLSWIVSIVPSSLQAKLGRAYEKIRKSQEIIDKYVIISSTDTNGIITNVSTCFTEVTGYNPGEAIGCKHNILKHPDTPKDAHTKLWETIKSGKVWEGELKDIDKTGKEFWIHQVITPEFNKQGEIEGYTAIAQDITDKKTIEKLSVTDSLTGLFNRHKLEEVLVSEIDRFERYNNSFCIIIIDIDFFKHINDTHGHPAGDEVLKTLGGLLRENTRNTDFICRWGGEEFMIIAVNSDLDNVRPMTEKIRLAVELNNFPVVGKVTISCGIAQCKRGEKISELIHRADNALYEAKKTGRNKAKEG